MKKLTTSQTERQYLTTKKIFIISIIVAALTIIGIWIFGLGQHRTLYENSVLSTTILSVAFFLFLAINLYRGVKLKDDLGRITDRITDKNKMPDLSGLNLSGDSIPDVGGDGIAGVIVGIIAWLLISILLVFLLWFFGAVLWVIVLIFAAMLYWIFFRALRLVFKNSNKCKNKISKSVSYALFYTVLYNFWIYGIIVLSGYLTK